MERLSHDLPDVRTEICYVFANAIDSGDKAKMQQFVIDINLLKLVS